MSNFVVLTQSLKLRTNVQYELTASEVWGVLATYSQKFRASKARFTGVGFGTFRHDVQRHTRPDLPQTANVMPNLSRSISSPHFALIASDASFLHARLELIVIVILLVACLTTHPIPSCALLYALRYLSGGRHLRKHSLWQSPDGDRTDSAISTLLLIIPGDERRLSLQIQEDSTHDF